MDRVRLERYLSGSLGEAARITSLSQAFPGLSRETWLVRLEVGRAGAAVGRGLVVRCDTPGGPIVPVDLEYEYQVYVHVARTTIPVARTLWFDAAPEPTDGRALFVREMVEGSTLLPGVGDAPHRLQSVGPPAGMLGAMPASPVPTSTTDPADDERKLRMLPLISIRSAQPLSQP